MTTQYISSQDKQPLIYLYDLPKGLATSVKIASIIKAKTGYELPEPVQFRDCKPHPLTGLASPFQLGIVKVDPDKLQEVANAIKYFNFEDGSVDEQGNKNTWECRALKFDRDLLGANKLNTNTQLNVFVKNIDTKLTTEQLHQKFQEQFGDIKSAKISRSANMVEVVEKQEVQNEDGQTVVHERKIRKADPSKPSVSNGYGFVCFQHSEDAEKAVSAGETDGCKIIRYQPKDPREMRKIYNNIYVKNFNPAWPKEKLEDIFSRFGDIKSCVVMNKAGKDGIIKPFAFICYDKEGDKTYGPEVANNAVTQMHEQELDGFKLYVQPAIPSDQRQAQVQRDQQRFKNSKKKCNLFVKGFPPQFGEEELKNVFGQFGEIESIKIIPAQEGQPTQRAFVCYKAPDSAANARVTLHGQTMEGKMLYVTNYELPEIRRKQQADAKDKADFMSFKRQNTGPIDPNLLARPDTVHLISQILMLVQKQMGGNNRYPNQGGNFNNQGTFGNRGPMQGNNMNRGGRQPYGNQGPRNNSYNRGPNQMQQQQYNQAPPQFAQQMAPVPQPVASAPVQVIIKDAQGPLLHPDPFINNYNMEGHKRIPTVFPGNPNLKQFVGEFIYEYVEKLVGEDVAPKITGMLIDLPIEEIKGYLYDFYKLQQKIGEAMGLLQQMAMQAQQQQ